LQPTSGDPVNVVRVHEVCRPANDPMFLLGQRALLYRRQETLEYKVGKTFELLKMFVLPGLVDESVLCRFHDMPPLKWLIS
jgi:hypothetical protein